MLSIQGATFRFGTEVPLPFSGRSPPPLGRSSRPGCVPGCPGSRDPSAGRTSRAGSRTPTPGRARPARTAVGSWHLRGEEPLPPRNVIGPSLHRQVGRPDALAEGVEPEPRRLVLADDV